VIGVRRLLPARRQRPAAETPKLREPVLQATLLIRPEVVHSIVRAASTESLAETGGPLMGTVQRSWEGTGGRLIVSVLGTVPPGPAMDADVGSVAMGDGPDGERAASALRWWRTTTGLHLVHLGDWHRHLPGSPGPSGGDRVTARRMREESSAPVWITAVAVAEPRREETLEASGNLGRATEAWSTVGEVRFYRQILGGGLVRMPIRLESRAIPRLPGLPWHVADPVRFAAECRLLGAAGFAMEIQTSAPGGGLGLTFRVRRDGAEPLTIVTSSRYPREAPVIVGDRGPRSVGDWSPPRFLVDIVDGKK
jgi:proteasome lid subunit RPN8/RPN11